MKATALTCDECTRPVLTIDPDSGVIRIESRHGGHRHVTMLTIQQFLERLKELALE